MKSRFCIAPLDVIKIRLQLQVSSITDPLSSTTTRPKYPGALSTFRTILREEGITVRIPTTAAHPVRFSTNPEPRQGLWKGNIPAEALYILYGGIQFSTYRYTTTLLHTLPTPNHQPLPSPVESFISGAVAGAVATTATYPLDLLRTRFAAQGPDRIYDSLLHSIRDIARTEGPRGFFQGLGAGVGQVVPYMGLFFAAYEGLRPALAGLELPFGSGDATAGVLAGVAAKTGVFPLDLVRKRLQVQGPTRGRYGRGNIPVSKGVARTMRGIVRREGVRGLYRGLTVSLVKAAPASAVTMWTYERALRVLKEMANGRTMRVDSV